MEFRWNEWNVGHVGDHGVTTDEAEDVVSNASSPFPTHEGDDKWLVWGRGLGDRLLQVVYIVEDDDIVFVIHARLLEPREKRRFRKRVSR